MNPIGIVGSGSVAQALGRALHDRGAPVVALAARDPDRAERAAAFVGRAVRRVEYAELVALAPYLIVAVSDEAITSVAGTLAAAGLRRGVVLHTSGARGAEALAPLGEAGVACGVLHPLQTLPSPAAGTVSLQGITFGIGGDPPAVDWGEAIADLLNGRVLHVAPGGFPAYHAAAVLAGNAVAALVDAALVLMERAGVEAGTALEALAPLCRASAEHVLAVGPVAALTGPVARGDVTTVRAHVRALAGTPPDVAELYVAASGRLLDLAGRRGLDEATGRRIAQVLQAARDGRRNPDASPRATPVTSG